MVNLEKYIQVDLDNKMQNGYKSMMAGNSVIASKLWLELWEMFKSVMKSHNIDYIEDLDESFQGSQSIYNWASDVEVELQNAMRNDKSYAQKLIDFSLEYIEKSKNKNDQNIIGMKRSIAAAYFKMGKSTEGDTIFQELINSDPASPWNWIGWSDQYAVFAEENNKDFDKAISILNKALEFQYLQDRLYVLDRLEGIYMELKKDDELTAIKQIIDEEKMKYLSQHKEASNKFANVKIGRNDPCPCGSGKKYKKCCG